MRRRHRDLHVDMETPWWFIAGFTFVGVLALGSLIGMGFLGVAIYHWIERH